MKRAVPADFAAGWDALCVVRNGLPALRFKGRYIIGMAQETGAGAQLFIDLYDRRAGGVVLAYSDLVRRVLEPHAVILKSPDEAAQYLEDLCLFRDVNVPVAKDIVASLADIQVKLSFQQHFSALVGEVLAEWDAERVL